MNPKNKKAPTPKQTKKKEVPKKVPIKKNKENEDIKRLYSEINAQFENCTLGNDAKENNPNKNDTQLNKINPLFDNTWVNTTGKKSVMVNSQEISQANNTSDTQPKKKSSGNSLKIPEGNYTYYPKTVSSTNEIPSNSNSNTNQQPKRTVPEITIPTSESEEEEAKDEYSNEYAMNYNKQQSTKNPQCSFNLGSSNLIQSFFSTKDTFYNPNGSVNEALNNINNNNINNNNMCTSSIPIDQSIQYRGRLSNSINSTTQSYIFNQTIPLFNQVTTPNNASMPMPISMPLSNSIGSVNSNPNASLFYSPTTSISSSFDFNNAFSYNNNHPIIINAKQSKNKQDAQSNFTINEQQIILGKDRRTTIMIKHIPTKYTCKELIEEIDHYFKNKYDLFYLPLNFDNENNLGYAFINFIDPLHIIHFCYCYKGKNWTRFKSKKECDLSYAKYQGREELVAFLDERSVKTKEKKNYVLFKIKEPYPRIIMPKSYYESIIFFRPKLANLVDFFMA